MVPRLRNALMFAAPFLAAGCLAEPGVVAETRADASGENIDSDAREVIDPGTPEATGSDVEVGPDVPLAGESWTLRSDQPTEVKAQSVVVVTLVVPDGVTPASVEWALEQPDGSVSLLTSSDLLHASVVANNVGQYRIVAVVYDAEGQLIARSSHTFLVVAGPGIQIELSWHTPGDPNEADMGGDFVISSAGSDVDLHMRSSMSDGAFFDPDFDCYWRNKNPEWAAFGRDDNPTLDRDDVDGAGPEILTLVESEVGQVFTVGVHYWDDWGYGDSLATLRIFIDGALQDEWAGVNLRSDDMWESHTIVDGVVTRIGTEPAITPGYQDGF